MSDASAATDDLADRLLDAQVAWLLSRLSRDEVLAHLAEDVDDLLALATHVSLGDAVEPQALKQLVRTALERVPPSAVASTMGEVVADAVHAGPTVELTAADLVDRDQLEAALAAAQGHTDLVALVLDRVAESPLAATVASRFVARVVGDVLATNRAVADRIPGMGSLMSLGTSVAGRVAGAADKQFEAVFGDTATGKGASFAVRRLNKLVVETLRDPTTLAAALEVFDMYAEEPLRTLLATVLAEGRLGDADELRRLAGLAQDLVIGAAPSPPVQALADALVDGFFAVYGTESLATLVVDLGLDRDEVLAHAGRLVPPLLDRALASGEVERVLRARLAPFFASPEVAAILAQRAQ